MKLETCSKCGNDLVKPEWHSPTKSIGNVIVANPHGCHKDSVHYQKNEHLHYYCPCGYDFIKEVTNG